MTAQRPRLSPLDVGLLRICALDDWTDSEADRAWAEFRATWGQVNEAALLTRLYLMRLLDESNRLTFLGRVELWDADLRADETIARLAS